MIDPTKAPSDRTALKRGKSRAAYDPSDIRAVLNAGVVAHVGVMTSDGPIVLPMAYGFTSDHIFIHGALANGHMNAGKAVDVCITVTIVDGLVVARSPFHNSMNYRSVVVRGEAAAVVDPDEKLVALKTINDHVAPIWDTARAPSAADYKKTLVLSVPLAEASAKIRSGGPIDDAADMKAPHWAGVVPLTSTWGDPVAATDLHGEPEVPIGVRGLAGANASPLRQVL